jgi:hypothetical protein
MVCTSSMLWFQMIGHQSNFDMADWTQIKLWNCLTQQYSVWIHNLLIFFFLNISVWLVKSMYFEVTGLSRLYLLLCCWCNLYQFFLFFHFLGIHLNQPIVDTFIPSILSESTGLKNDFAPSICAQINRFKIVYLFFYKI